MSVLVIAEAGVNHNGDMDMAKRMVEEAAKSGADIVKFQSFRARSLVTRAAPKADYQRANTGAGETQSEMLKKLELSEADHHNLLGWCNSVGIGFLSTPFDVESANFLVGLGVKMIKIPSGEITNLPYLRHIGGLGCDLILSTGMSSLGEVECALDVLQQSGARKERIVLLHCTTEYPAPAKDVNLKAMLTLRDAFGVRVGYSDHTEGIEVAIAAAALGASVVEKHFTLDRKLPGPDHKASLEPGELRQMVAAIRKVEASLGDGIKRITESERKNKAVARKSIVARAKIVQGEVFTTQNLCAKRPGSGISPMRWDEFIGKAAARSYDEDEMIDG